MIPLRDQEGLRERFKTEITSRLRIDFFTQKPSSIFVPGRQDCVYCAETQTLLEEIASLNERISLTVHEIDVAPALAESLGVDKVPGIVVRGQTNRALRYFGLPSGTQFPAFIDTLVDASRGTVDLRPDTVKQLRKLKSDVALQVMVTTSDQHSPGMARTAARFGLQSSRFKVSIVEVAEFPPLLQRYALRAVPTTVIQDKIALPGAMDEETLLQIAIRVLEGRPLTGQLRTGPATALAPAQPSQAQQPRTAGSSGLILPR